MKCSLGISDFLEEISSLSHSIVFLYFFTLITEEGFLISPFYSLELCIQMDIFPFLLCLSLLFFTQPFVRPPQTTILPFAFLFLVGVLHHLSASHLAILVSPWLLAVWQLSHNKSFHFYISHIEKWCSFRGQILRNGVTSKKYRIIHQSCLGSPKEREAWRDSP